MSVGVEVGSIIDVIGAPSFLNSFFSTVAYVLEGNNPGTRYPVVSIDFYSGMVPVGKVQTALNELKDIQVALGEFPPSAVVWDREDWSKQPPWKGDISREITSLGNYFVTSGGKDLFSVLYEVFEAALDEKQSVKIVEA